MSSKPVTAHNPWLLFEAGALSKTLEQTCVCPLVFEMTLGQLEGPLTQFQANSLDRDGIGKVIHTINKCLDDRQIDSHQLDQIIDVWWPHLETILNMLAPMPEPTATRTTGDQLDELLTLARENLRRENLRLEASREREEKLDAMLGFMDKAGSTMGALQNHAQRMQSSIAHGIEAAIALPTSTGVTLETTSTEMQEAFRTLASLISPPAVDLGPIEEMTTMLKDLSKRDKERTDSMLNPESKLKNDEQ